MDAEVLVDSGAFASNWIYNVVATLLRNTYNFEAWRIEVLELLTNKASIAAYRAPGAVNAAFAMESQMDEMARRLNLDPVELRRRNLTLEGDLLAAWARHRRGSLGWRCGAGGRDCQIGG
jgi:CO/xanthine dehydrogenase Mo-binding subunit